MGLGQVVCGDGLHCARPLARHWLRYRRCYRRCYGWQRMTPARRAFHECRMQFPRHCAAPRNHIVGIATFADTVESSFNRIACETAASALAACVPRRARGSDTSRVGLMVCAWAAPRRIPWGWRACHGVNAHCRRFACERRTRSGAVASKSQSTLPTTPHCRRLLSRWFATWAALPRGAPSPTVNGGNCAARGPCNE